MDTSPQYLSGYVAPTTTEQDQTTGSTKQVPPPTSDDFEHTPFIGEDHFLSVPGDSSIDGGAPSTLLLASAISSLLVASLVCMLAMATLTCLKCKRHRAMLSYQYIERPETWGEDQHFHCIVYWFKRLWTLDWFSSSFCFKQRNELQPIIEVV